MRYLTLSLTALVLTTACSREHQNKPSPAPVGFLDKVWTVVRSPGGSGDTYVFLSDGTFIRASKGGEPDVGKWGWDGQELTVVWNELPYVVEIDSLTDSYFQLTFQTMNQSFDVGLVPATAEFPDTTEAAEFDPALASISANGHNPTWLLQIDGGRATLRLGREGMSYEDGEWIQECASVWDFTAYHEQNGVRESVEMQLSTEVCVDSTTGAEYPLVAVLQMNHRTLFGCAIAGKSASHR